MNVPRSNISIDEWFDYLDERAELGTRQRIDEAIAADASARQIWDALRDSMAAMREEAMRLHRMTPMAGLDVDAACDRVLAAARDGSERVLAPARLEQMELLLTPWCGRRVAAGLVLAAMARAGGASRDKLWPSFVGQVEALTSRLCGSAAGRLTGEFGRSLA